VITPRFDPQWQGIAQGGTVCLSAQCTGSGRGAASTGGWQGIAQGGTVSLSAQCTGSDRGAVSTGGWQGIAQGGPARRQSPATGASRGVNRGGYLPSYVAPATATHKKKTVRAVRRLQGRCVGWQGGVTVWSVGLRRVQAMRMTGPRSEPGPWRAYPVGRKNKKKM
jgi:hypothetical protein